MEENLKIDNDYLTAFNLGYELAKDLNLKSSLFKDVNSKNERINAMQDGMEQYSNEIAVQKNKGSTLGLNIGANISNEHKGRGKGFDFSI
ncbi:hypothetical protein LCGC14_0889760 [marine sediment metagenome]|uniref:Uncharacterized protein n=2 Tax=root TaxID=1 RepID=A0A831QU82_9FLAO|nr:hypothetical protein [Pricia sp.]HEA23740.1 hypothetical protein [Pricia antarctica]